MHNKLFILILVLLSLLFPKSVNGIDLIKEGAIFKYYKGTKEASSPRSAWTAIDFDDSSWLRGKIPFYSNENIANGSELADMKGITQPYMSGVSFVSMTHQNSDWDLLK